MSLFTKAIDIKRHRQTVRIRCLESNHEAFHAGGIYSGLIGLLSGNTVEVIISQGGNNFNVRMKKNKRGKFGKFRFILE